jgi:hypothetical protein
MLDAASKQMADQFFKRLGQELGDGQSPSSSAAQPNPGAHATHAAGPSTTHPSQAHAATLAPAALSEGTRLLWFACGCAATGFGVVLASLLR